MITIFINITFSLSLTLASDALLAIIIRQNPLKFTSLKYLFQSHAFSCWCLVLFGTSGSLL